MGKLFKKYLKNILKIKIKDMISHKYKFIFIPNMRVGSQSISHSLKGISLYNDSHHTALELKTGKFTSPASIRLHNSDVTDQIKQNWDKYYKFAFVRNPYDHFLSIYFYLKKNNVTNLNFNDYCVQQNLEQYSSMKDWSFTNLFNRVSDENGNIIVDFIGKFESFDDDWNKITEKLNLPATALLLNINKTVNRKKYDFYYNKNQKDIVYKLYKKDFNSFGYER